MCGQAHMISHELQPAHMMRQAEGGLLTEGHSEPPTSKLAHRGTNQETTSRIITITDAFILSLVVIHSMLIATRISAAVKSHE